MSRGTVQPFRRNSALHRVYDDLILYLKAENNYVDSSFYVQQVIQPSGLTHVVDKNIALPGFDNEKWVTPMSSYHKPSYNSFVFSGQRSLTNSVGDIFEIKGDSLAVSGTGVFAARQDADSASEFNIEDDFTIELWAQFSGLPAEDPNGGVCMFDFGNLQLWNWGGNFTVKAGDKPELDYYDYYFTHGFTPFEQAEQGLTEAGSGDLTQKYNHIAVQKRDENLELWLGSQNADKTAGTFSKVAEQSVQIFNISGNADDPYKNLRTFGSTISGTNFFSGWMDEIKVWKKAIYGPEPININNTPKIDGIYYHRGAKAVNENDYWNRWAKEEVRSNWNYIREPYIKCGSDLTLFTYVYSYYDPRYSLSNPIPYIVDWYKYTDGSYGKKVLVASSKDGNTTTYKGGDSKYEAKNLHFFIEQYIPRYENMNPNAQFNLRYTLKFENLQKFENEIGFKEKDSNVIYRSSLLRRNTAGS